MIRNLGVVVAVFGTAFVGLSCAGVASADPGPATLPCEFALSPPQLTSVSGVKMTTATLTPKGCTGEEVINMSVVCLRSADGDSQGQCKQGNTFDGAQVFSGYTPGTKYVATGNGCASVFDTALVAVPGQSVCKAFGPISATL
jgi:hypothetical protein